MDKCKHVTKFNLGDNHSILNPQKWVCIVCGTTESVWACLNCKHVGCGRFNDEHAVKHFQEAGHPIAIEVNEKYVYCYICEEYVLNDNAAGDIKLLRTMLSAIATQNFEGVVPEVRSGRFLRSAIVNSGESESAEQVLREADKIFTAFRHRRFVLLSSTFYAWRDYVRAIKTMASAPTPVKEEKAEPVAPSVVPKRKHAFKPGVTGLRNLGNTCYMNSIIQVLGHITEFREYFINMKVAHCNAYTNTGKNKNKCYKSGKNMTTVRVFARQTTQEAKQHVEQKDKSCWSKKQDNGGKVGSGTKSSTKGKGCIQGGLNGGSCPSASGAGLQKMAVENKAGKTDDTVSLCHELHDLYRVLWSAKWAIVSPHSLLHAVWKAIPSFKGFSQQDAQEFLCELVERLQAELTDMLPQENALTRSLNSKCPRGWTYVPVTYNITLPKTLLKNIFQGELVSEVSCVACGHKSHTYEPFWDLSLEFPDKYNVLNSPEGSFSEDNCDLTEMLAKFTEKESLEGNVYACDQCNSRRRSTSKKPLTLSAAEKSLMVHRTPKILRLHLKRFRWAGRLHREKIKAHVKFEHRLNVWPYCNPALTDESYEYELMGVIMHHGRGFGSGHYTCNCWNPNANSWVHCNDARLEPCSVDEVLQSQAYILFYARVPMPVVAAPPPAAITAAVAAPPPADGIGVPPPLAGSEVGVSATLRPNSSDEEDDEVTFKPAMLKRALSVDGAAPPDDGNVKKPRTSV